MFEALRRFKDGEQNRVIYLPGNHDAEVWWNPEIRDTLREQGLIDEFAFSYLASLEVGGKRRIVYCEHGNQFDPANTVEDYGDPLDTPLGHHAVTDFTRRIAPLGEVTRGLNLSDIKNVYPLVAIPQWVASRYFYNILGMLATYLLLPLLLVYIVYRIVAYYLAGVRNIPVGFLQSYQELPRVHEVFLDIAFLALLILLIFGIFFLAIRRAVRQALNTVSPKQGPHYSPAETSQDKIRAVLKGEGPLPMNAFERPEAVDVFVSGHTHLPSLVERDGGQAIMVNSGCWLRQLQPVMPHFKGPPVFISRFVLTHVRVFLQGSSLRLELWEHPKPAGQRLSRTERLLSWNRRLPQPPPNSKPRVRVASIL